MSNDTFKLWLVRFGQIIVFCVVPGGFVFIGLYWFYRFIVKVVGWCIAAALIWNASKTEKQEKT